MNAHKESTPNVVAAIVQFQSRTLVSKRALSVLLGISPSTLIRWFDSTSEPYDWTAEQALRRIELFDKAHEKTGLYDTLATMTPRERVDTLKQVLEEYTKS